MHAADADGSPHENGIMPVTTHRWHAAASGPRQGDRRRYSCGEATECMVHMHTATDRWRCTRVMRLGTQEGAEARGHVGEGCREWRAKKMASRRQAEEEDRKERQRRGMLTGREIFMQSQTAIVDDDTAAADTDMMREIDEEEAIAHMQALALESQRQARVEVRPLWRPLWPPLCGQFSGVCCAMYATHQRTYRHSTKLKTALYAGAYRHSTLSCMRNISALRGQRAVDAHAFALCSGLIPAPSFQ